MWKRNCMKTTGSKQHIMVASGGFPRRSWPGLLNLWASATGPQFYQEGQVNNFYLISFKKYLTNIFILAALGLCCCLQAFSSCSKWGLLFSCLEARRLLIAGASLVAEHELYGAWASVVVVHRLSCPVAHEIFLDQGLNLCPLHWKMDS